MYEHFIIDPDLKSLHSSDTEEGSCLTGNEHMHTATRVNVCEHLLLPQLDVDIQPWPILLYTIPFWCTNPSWHPHQIKKQQRTEQFDKLPTHTHLYTNTRKSKKKKPLPLCQSNVSVPAHPSMAVWWVITDCDCVGRGLLETAHAWQVALSLGKEWGSERGGLGVGQ